MGDYNVYRTVRKRKGYYSEYDIHSTTCSYTREGPYNTTYYGSYNLSKYKTISITETKEFRIKSYEVYGYINDNRVVYEGYNMYQYTTVQIVPNPSISINNDLGVIGDACSIKYNIYDSNPDVSFKITVKLNDVVISEKNNTVDSNYTIDLTDEHLSNLVFNSVNNITIELGTVAGGKMLDKTVTFTKGNTKPKLNISSYNSTTAIFTAIDADNNLSKIEWFIDDVLKETITTDLYLEKTINYELTDNAIHTLKIVATDAESASVEKVLSISKEIMPLQTDSTLQDISSKLVEIGEGFKNGKTSIINTLALKNIDANLNNTLVELSEKIKTSFDSGDASLQDLMNQLTQANNTISQLSSQFKVAGGTSVAQRNDGTKIAYEYKRSTTSNFGGWLKINGLAFKPNIFVADCEYYDSKNRVDYKFLTFACCGFTTSGKQDFVAVSIYSHSSGSDKYTGDGFIYNNNEGDVWFNANGVQVPAYLPGGSGSFTYTWRAVKFMNT